MASVYFLYSPILSLPGLLHRLEVELTISILLSAISLCMWELGFSVLTQSKADSLILPLMFSESQTSFITNKWDIVSAFMFLQMTCTRLIVSRAAECEINDFFVKRKLKRKSLGNPLVLVIWPWNDVTKGNSPLRENPTRVTTTNSA